MSIKSGSKDKCSICNRHPTHTCPFTFSMGYKYPYRKKTLHICGVCRHDFYVQEDSTFVPSSTTAGFKFK